MKMERSRSAFDHWMHRHHFTFRDTRGRNITVQCNLCLPKINILSSARDSTSNLKKHLEVTLSYICTFFLFYFFYLTLIDCFFYCVFEFVGQLCKIKLFLVDSRWGTDKSFCYTPKCESKKIIYDHI